MLDARAVQIKADLDEARALREEAKTILASYERKQKDVQAQADRIVATAQEEAMAAAAQAKDDLKVSIARRVWPRPRTRSPRPKPPPSAQVRERPCRWRSRRQATCWPSR